MMERIGKNKDIISGIFFFVTSAILYGVTYTFRRLTISRVGSAFIPRIVFALIMILSIIVIIEGVIKRKILVGEHEVSEKTNDSLDFIERHSVLLTILLIGIYAAFLRKIGFLIMTTIYLIAQFNILAPKTERKQILFIIISVVTTVVIYFVFVKGFKLLLPSGILG